MKPSFPEATSSTMSSEENEGYMIALIIIMVLNVFLLVTTIGLLLVHTRRNTKLLEEVIRRELSRFLYGRDDMDTSESRGILPTRAKMAAPISVSSAFRTLRKTPATYFTTEHGYSRLDLDEECSSNVHGRNSYSPKVLTV